MLIIAEELVYSIVDEKYKLAMYCIDEKTDIKINEISYLMDEKSLKMLGDPSPETNPIMRSNVHRKKLENALLFVQKLNEIETKIEILAERDVLDERFFNYMYPSVQFKLRNIENILFEIGYVETNPIFFFATFKGDRIDLQCNENFRNLYEHIAFWIKTKGKHRIRILLN